MVEPKYLVYGTGALGSVFGGFLHKSGADVTFFDIGGPHYEAILKNGIKITGIWGDHQITSIKTRKALSEIKDTFDIVLLAVKSTHTEIAAPEAVKYLKQDGLIVSIQNGLNNVETIAKYAGNNRTVGGRIIFGVEIPQPGTAKVTVYADKVLFGAPFGSVNQELLKRLESDLNNAKIPTTIETNIMAFIWGKVLYNSALNPLGAILDVEYGLLGDNEETRNIMQEILREIFLIIKKKGIKVPYKDSEEYFKFFLEKQLPPTYNHHSSMFQDLKAGRMTEIDALNGAICQYGRELGVPTPYNDFITKLIKFKQAQMKKK